mmetsp:Transcript_166844/g.535525  ORF Transcript_166844/g.535525 Transcript_166844/m.535525 type:complete len:331 (-) Transcript_166844:1895-2887(-)
MLAQPAHSTKACAQCFPPAPTTSRAVSRFLLGKGGPLKMMVSELSLGADSRACRSNTCMAKRRVDGGTNRAGAPGASMRCKSSSHNRASRSSRKVIPTWRRSVTSLLSSKPLQARCNDGRSWAQSSPSPGPRPTGRKRRCCSRCHAGCDSSTTSMFTKESVCKNRAKAVSTASLKLLRSSPKLRMPPVLLLGAGPKRWPPPPPPPPLPPVLRAPAPLAALLPLPGTCSELLESELNSGAGHGHCTACRTLRRGNGSAGNASGPELLESELNAGSKAPLIGWARTFLALAIIAFNAKASGTPDRALPAASSASLVCWGIGATIGALVLRPD